jgi:hypothetical protein
MRVKWYGLNSEKAWIRELLGENFLMREVTLCRFQRFID